MVVSLNPYQSPAFSELASHSRADKWSAIIIRSAMFATACYAPLFAVAILTIRYALPTTGNLQTLAVAMFLAVHGAVMLLNMTAFLFTGRDWLNRRFNNSNAKFWWLVAIVMTGGIGWVWYILKFKLWQHHHKSEA